MKRDLLKPTADVVFKRIFGQEKEIAIEFINLFVEPPVPVVDIIYLKQEMLADNRDGKVSVVDIRCTLNLKNSPPGQEGWHECDSS